MSSTDRRIAMASAHTGMTDAVRLAEVLDATRIVVDVPTTAGPAVVAAAAAVISMCGRVFGDVAIARNAAMPINPWHVHSLDDLLDLLPGGSAGPVQREVTVSFGDHRGADWFVGGDDWTTVVSRRPTTVGPARLGGLGLQAAAAIVFGEVLKQVLMPLGMRCLPIEHTLVWNLLDGRLAPAPTVDSSAHACPTAAFLGGGSVGSSGIGVLMMTPVVGDVVIVDPDHFQPARNNYRYPAVPPGLRGSKAVWGADVLATSGWEARPFDGTIGDWVTQRPLPGFDGIALVSVDRVDGRLDAADLLARTTVSVGVAGLALHAQRSTPFDNWACSYCAYVDVAPPLTQLEVYARLTGLTSTRITELLNGATLTHADVDTASEHCGPDADREDLIGGRLEDLLHRRYARAPLSDANGAVVAEVSAPHVSWLGGVLLATEVVKTATGLPLLDRRIEVDLSGVPIGGWRRPARDPSGRCTCANPVRRSFARQLYAA